MKKYIYLALVAVIALSFACGGAEVKKEGAKAEKPADPKAVKAQELNTKLDAVAVKGFAANKAALPKDWAKCTPVVKEAVAGLPEGYVLEIAGHLDAKEADEMGKGKAVKKLSEERAKAVKDALKKAKVDSPNITVKGVADPKDGAVVHFKVVAK
jgi:outer membrane protein OmpA-like peptidoglycan-associated protein